MACEKRCSRHCLLFAFQLRRSAVEATEMVCARYWERTLYLTDRAKSGSKDSKPKILIRKTTIVRGHRESSMTVSWREIDRRKSFIRRIGGKKVSKLAISIRLKQLDLILHLIYVIKSWKKFGKRRERENLFPHLMKFLYCHTSK